MREVEVNVSGRWIAGGIAGLMLGAYLAAGVTSVELHEGAFKQHTMGSDKGQTEELISGGYTWVEPITNNVFNYDTRNKQYDDNLKNIQEGIASADGQPLVLDLSLDIGLDRTKLYMLHTKYGPDWYEEIVFPLVRSQTRFATGGVKSDNIYTIEGKQQMADYLNSKLAPLSEFGIVATANIRRVDFTNQEFKDTLENKSKAKQLELTEDYNAQKAVKTAEKMKNLAEGEKQKRIKAAEADREERRLRGEGQRLEKEENALGILAIAKANAEGTRLQVKAYGHGKFYSQVKVAEALGDNFQVWGIPTGAPGTNSFIGLDGLMKKAVVGGSAAE